MIKLPKNAHSRVFLVRAKEEEGEKTWTTEREPTFFLNTSKGTNLERNAKLTQGYSGVVWYVCLVRLVISRFWFTTDCEA